MLSHAVDLSVLYNPCNTKCLAYCGVYGSMDYGPSPVYSDTMV